MRNFGVERFLVATLAHIGTANDSDSFTGAILFQPHIMAGIKSHRRKRKPEIFSSRTLVDPTRRGKLEQRRVGNLRWTKREETSI